MNHERMLKVADVIEANPENFNIHHFAVVPAVASDRYPFGWVGLEDTGILMSADLQSCGTTACIAGWACWLWGAEVNRGHNIADNAANILGISWGTADDLFNNWDLTTASKAAEHLRTLVQEDL